MSAVSEAQEKIALASSLADEAERLAVEALDTMEKVLLWLDSAAGDTGHEKIVEAMQAHSEAVAKLTDARVLVAAGQLAADGYAVALG